MDKKEKQKQDGFEQFNEEYETPQILLEPYRGNDLFRRATPTKTHQPKYQVYEGVNAYGELRKLEEKYGSGKTTGFSQLDNYFKFIPEQLYLLSAPTHHGKTMIAVNMCTYSAMRGNKVLFISLEQGIFVSKFVEGIAGVAYPETLSILDTSEMLSVRELLLILRKLPHYDLICLDHLHFLKRKGKGATEDVDEIVHELQNVAKEIQTPILAISHLRKLNHDKPPSLDDLKDTVSLSQVPSVVMLVRRQENEDGLSDVGVLYIKKNRIQGKTGALKFMIKEKFKIVFEGDEDLPTEPEKDYEQAPYKDEDMPF